MTTFVQLGATRDGLDPYLRIARSRGMQAVLIETPDYIQFRTMLERQEFDETIAVEHPADLVEVLTALKQLSETPVLILAGFERYIYTAYAVAEKLRILPYHENYSFVPPNKAEQRQVLSQRNLSILQPAYHIFVGSDMSSEDLTDLTFPLVVKPIDGGGGLGVFLVSNTQELEVALSELKTTTNYDGGSFKGVVIENFVSGVEYSVQGIAHHGIAKILTFCKKIIITEPNQGTFLQGFREVGHIAIRGSEVNREVKDLIQQCIDALGYKDGPFHHDIVRSGSRYYHLEMGFRLSGSGLARLVQRVGGCDWAEETFISHLETTSPCSSNREANVCVGQITAVSSSEIDAAHNLRAKGYKIAVQLFNTTPAMNSSSLRSDIIRHGGSLGRIIISDSNSEVVESLLYQCASERILQSISL